MQQYSSERVAAARQFCGKTIVKPDLFKRSGNANTQTLWNIENATRTSQSLQKL